MASLAQYKDFEIFHIGYVNSVFFSPNLLIRLPIGGHLSNFQLWATANKADMNIFIQVFVWT